MAGRGRDERREPARRAHRCRGHQGASTSASPTSVGRWRHVAREAGGVDRRRCCARACSSTARRSRAGATSPNPTSCCGPTSPARSPTRSPPSRRWSCSATGPSRAPAWATSATRARPRCGPRPILRRCRHADEVRVAAELAFFLFDEVKVELGPMRGSYQLDRQRAPHRQRARRGARRPPARPGCGLPVAAAGRPHGRHPRRDRLGAGRRWASADLKQAHGRAGGQNELCYAAGGLVGAADRVQTMKYVDPPGGGVLRQGRDLHAQARGRRAGLGHARAPGAVARRQAHLRRPGLCRPQRALPAVRRRHHAPCQGAQRLHQPDHQQLQAPARRARTSPRCSPTPPTTARPRSASPTRRGPRTSGSRCASPTPAPTPISPSPRS